MHNMNPARVAPPVIGRNKSHYMLFKDVFVVTVFVHLFLFDLVLTGHQVQIRMRVR